jgi:hypothetical protein
MKQRFPPTCQLTFATALLCAGLAGCAGESTSPDETSDDSSGSLNGAGNQGVQTQGQAISIAKDLSSESQFDVSQGGPTSDGSIEIGSIQSGSTQSVAPDPAQALFQKPTPWTKNVSALSKNASSDAIITWLNNAGGWGSGNKLKIDFGLTVLEATSATPKKSFIATDEFYSPDCQQVSFPVPAGGALEGESGYACDNDGDCHLIVVHKTENKLYEMWRANMTGGTFYGGCAVVWDLLKAYPDNLRGEGCTSADAGGFPIAAMVFTPAEVQSGTIGHALRFILPNNRIRKKVYVHPGTHSTFATSGGTNAPPYGVRFRLRKDYPLQNLPSDGARTIAKALQTYGMFLSDGGNIAMTGASDKYSSVKWSSLNVNNLSLTSIKVTDMEVVDMGAPIQWSGDCTLN